MYLRNTWYVAMWASDLVAGSLAARTICEQPIVGSHLLTPTDRSHGAYHIAAVQLGGLPPGDTAADVADQLSRLRRFAFEEQDRPMVEAQQRAYDRAGV